MYPRSQNEVGIDKGYLSAGLKNNRPTMKKRDEKKRKRTGAPETPEESAERESPIRVPQRDAKEAARNKKNHLMPKTHVSPVAFCLGKNYKPRLVTCHR